MGSGKLTPEERLGHNNWRLWSVKMEAMLIDKDLWDCVAPQAPGAAEGESTPAWRKRADKAKAVLVLNSSDSIAMEVAAATSARAAWAMLKARFAGSMLAREVSLQQQLNSVQLRNGESMREFFARIRALVADLAAAGADVRERHIVTAVARSLPKSFVPYAAGVLMSPDQAHYTVDHLEAALVSAEGMLMGGREDKVRSEISGGAYSAQRAGGRAGGRGKRLCFNCGDPTHLVRNCPHPRQQQQGSVASARASDQQPYSLVM